MKKMLPPYSVERINGWWYLIVDHGKRTEYSAIFEINKLGMLAPVKFEDHALRVARKLLRQSRF